MMDKLHIENYRLFNKLEIDGLKQINLITGKNNTGKSALLEAIRIYRTDMRNIPELFSHLIGLRNGFQERLEISLRSLINKREIIEAGWIGNYSFDINEYKFLLDDMTIKIYNKPENNEVYFNFSKTENNRPYGNYQFIPSNTNFDNSYLWDKVYLTKKESIVLDAMKLILPYVDRIGVNASDKKARILEIGNEEPIPLAEFGEGSTRLFTIALALVNAENSILLIDEVDIGLHHSVQLKLWNFIFQLAKELNVQVFATTHSYDAVDAFTQVSSKEEYADMGNYFRLQHRRDGQGIEAVNYTQKELEIATLGQIETR